MNLTAYVLAALGFLMIFLEFFLPGGILGSTGAIFLIASIVIFALYTKSGIALFLFILGIAALAAFMIWFTLQRIKMGKIKGIFLNSVQEGYLASEWEKELVGKDGIALSDLKPSGHILVNEKRYQAVSKTGYLEKGTKIIVIGGEGAHLIVKEKVENDRAVGA